MFTLPNQLQASLDALKANTVTFSGTAKFPDGDPATGSLVYMTAGTYAKVFKPPKGITRVDNDGKFKITLLKSDLTNLPKKKFNNLKVFAVSSENPSKTWSKKVAPGVKYDVDFTLTKELNGLTRSGLDTKSFYYTISLFKNIQDLVKNINDDSAPIVNEPL